MAAGPLALSFLCILVGKALSARHVALALAAAGTSLNRMASYYVYSLADISKYLPGGVWGLIGRVALYREINMRPRAITQALVVENVWLLAGAAWVGLAAGCLGLAGGFAGLVSARLGLSAAAVAAFAWPAALLVLLPRLMRPPGGGRTIAGFVCLQALMWTLIGISFAVLLPYSVAPWSLAAGLLTAIGIYDFSFALGMVAFFAPSGIGVRESTLVATLGPVHGIDLLIQISIINRFVWVAADIVFALVARLLCREAWLAAKARSA